MHSFQKYSDQAVLFSVPAAYYWKLRRRQLSEQSEMGKCHVAYDLSENALSLVRLYTSVYIVHFEGWGFVILSLVRCSYLDIVLKPSYLTYDRHYTAIITE